MSRLTSMNPLSLSQDAKVTPAHDIQHSSDQDYCFPRTVGYHPARIMAAIEGTGFGETASASADGLTYVMILHPIACGIAFIAFLLSLGAGVVGSLLGALVAALAFILTLIVMATDFACFGVCSSPLLSLPLSP